jgi:transcriptional regulator with XRE-family HTH domain
MNNLQEGFGQRLREIRKGRNLTQEVFSEMIDLSPRQLIRIEKGDNFPSAETLSKISLVFKVGLKSLFDFKWDEDVMYLATGTYNRPVLRLVKNNEIATVKHCNQASEKFEVPKTLPFDDSDRMMLKIAKNTNKPITVEYFDNKKRFAIKTFYPDGKIDNVLSEKAVLNDEKYNYIAGKIKEISQNSNKLEFIKLALDTFEDKSSLEKLKSMIQGMELAQE